MTKRISSGYDNGNNKKQSTICDTKNNKQERVRERKASYCTGFILWQKVLGKFYYCHANNKAPLKTTICFNVHPQTHRHSHST